MTFDENATDLELLSLASDKRKFAIDIGYVMWPGMLEAFERGIDKEWFTLVDVCVGVEAAPGRIMRVFRLTDAGMLRLAAVKGTTS